MTDKYMKETDFLTPSEAAYRWGVKRNTLIAALNRGRFDDYLDSSEVKKFTQHGSTEWAISVRAMREVFRDEDMVQVFEMANLVGETLKPRSAVFFNGHFVYTTKPGERISSKLLGDLRKCDDHMTACELLKQRV
ncbi:hypothetical protein [Paenibacillus sp. FSL H7-0714]|uniref:hypothetical protein n=1 Tax=Paenibacillus sp. FSL H7-0714 TaxID=2954735 RepID=UPI0030F4C741